MMTGVENAFKEMLDISGDIEKALLFGSEGVLATNMDAGAESVGVEQARELILLSALRATDMGSGPMTQLVLETSAGMVFLVREAAEDGLVALATGKKGGKVGLALYDLKTCIRDAREAMEQAEAGAGEGEER